MYSINIQSTEDYSTNQPFKTNIEIVPNNSSIEKLLKNHYADETHYYINLFYNPLLRLFGFAPVVVRVQDSPFQTAVSHKIEINSKLLFSFKNKRTRKLFEEKVTIEIRKHIDSLIEYCSAGKSLQES